MNCLSVNIRGLGVDGKPGWIRKLKRDFGISFIGLQETMACDIQTGLVSSIWGGNDFEFDFVCANGNSGGILNIWDPKVFIKESITKDPNFLHVAGMILANSVRLNMVNVYAPQSNTEKRLLWLALILVGGFFVAILMRLETERKERTRSLIRFVLGILMTLLMLMAFGSII